MCFGREVDWKHSGNRKRVALTFLTINEGGKWSHLKMSVFSNEILARELTLVQCLDSIYHDLKKKGMEESKERRRARKKIKKCTSRVKPQIQTFSKPENLILKHQITHYIFCSGKKSHLFVEGHKQKLVLHSTSTKCAYKCVCVYVSNQACSSCSALALSCSKLLYSSSVIFFLRASSSTGDQERQEKDS